MHLLVPTDGQVLVGPRRYGAGGRVDEAPGRREVTSVGADAEKGYVNTR